MDEARKGLCRYRLEKAEKCLSSAKVLVQSEDYCGAANRSYYAMFHCIRSLLALEGVDFSKHAGVMAVFPKKLCQVRNIWKRIFGNFNRSVSS